ncbi:MAG: hypothetical protein A2W85_10230 [Bacteroidetes bacterium GWF2_41_31]|nr:MAG: hypothetical protein A2W85_10230 [Bacteroidetes bacterium GWF2_41_31]OFZ05892.1 MAG: hypothetical protein A2338_01240 [Bacteroidetes bacterium RIFOXYB12_FULL_41_6]
MIYLDKQSTDPWFNLAAEEVALKNCSEDILMLWENQPSLVLGKHQNAMAEVNHAFVFKHQIPVIRRISGGGTVYHDHGNLNYSVITTVENQERSIDFHQFAEPIILFLKQFGLEVTFHGKTNLAVNGRKFSGNAAHVFKNRVLHHGTLLFNTDLNKLEQSIRPTEALIQDKSIKSVRSEIINLQTLLPGIQALSEFQLQFKQFLEGYFSITQSRTFTASEREEIQRLVIEKYRTPDWNYGYSTAYQFNKSGNLLGRKAELNLEVKKGIIVALQLQSTILPKSLIQSIQQQLINKPHHPQAMNTNIQYLETQLQSVGIEASALFYLLI